MKKYIALLLTLAMALSLFAGCGKTETPEVPETPADTTVETPETPETPAEPETPTEPEVQLTDEEILWVRREAAEAYLREMASIRWRSDVKVEYKYSDSQTTPIIIEAGRLYEGLPYSYAGASLGAWLDHPGTMDEKGVYNMTGLNVDLLGGNSTSSRIGIDCSATLSHSWQSVGAQVRTESTNAMTEANGFIKVGEYEAPSDQYTSTKEDCQKNGQEVIFAAYAQLQKGDGIVTSNGSGHARFVVEINVVKDDAGAIIGGLSTVKTIEKNATAGKADIGSPYYDEAAGENVYPCLHVDREYTFTTLFEGGYLPVTNTVFTDPSPMEEPTITDSITEPDKTNLTKGTISCNWALDNVAITITDASGKEVQSSVMHPQRRTELTVSMSQFQTDPESKLVGKIKLADLTEGTYHAKVTARTVAGHELTVREFDFAVEADAADAPAVPGEAANEAQLAAALKEGGNVKLTADITLTQEGEESAPKYMVPAGVTVTLDLNGHTIFSDDGFTKRIGNAGTLTIVDNSAAKNGGITVVGASGSAQCVRNTGALTIRDGVFSVTVENIGGYVLYSKGKTLDLQGGTFRIEQASATAKNTVDALGLGGDTVLTVADGVKVEAVNRSTGEGSTANVMYLFKSNNVKATVHGGSFNIVSEAGNSAVVRYPSKSSPGTSVITLAGGEFCANDLHCDGPQGTLEITGGKFATAAGAACDVSEFLAAGYAQQADGTVVKK